MYPIFKVDEKRLEARLANTVSLNLSKYHLLKMPSIVITGAFRGLGVSAMDTLTLAARSKRTMLTQLVSSVRISSPVF
jgi:hypothetical protein